MAPGSPEERAILHSKVGLDEDAKAILLAQALDAIRSGLQAPGLEHRLRAASMAVSILGGRPSRNPMGPAAPAPRPAPAAAPAWLPAPGANVAPQGEASGAGGVARTVRAQEADDLGLDESPF